jgi:membrane protease YdiL (CAAX protease family)
MPETDAIRQIHTEVEMNRSGTYDENWRKASTPSAAQAVPGIAEQERQYSLTKILAIWAAAVVPMVVLGWVVAPLIGDSVDLGVGDHNREAVTRAGLLTIGLIWQFVLCMAIIFREEGDLRWSTIRRRCWLNAPRDPRTGQSNSRFWWWLVPLILVYVALQGAPLDLPFIDEPAKYSFQTLMDSEDRKADLEGAWHVLGLFLVLGVFNTILGEELLFRGILLPRMRGVFGKRDWIANGVLFGLYHLHQPWGIVKSTIDGIFCLAWPSRRFRSAWMGIIVHSSQTLFFVFIALGLVLGLA